jgi:hypothetical protein
MLWGYNRRMLIRSRIRSTAKVMLFALFFAQAAIAAASCDMPGRTPAQAFAHETQMPCHEEPAQNANVCLAHCLSADQSADTPQVIVHDWSGALPLTVAVVEYQSSRADVWQRYLPHPAAPPPRILFQSFQI